VYLVARPYPVDHPIPEAHLIQEGRLSPLLPLYLVVRLTLGGHPIQVGLQILGVPLFLEDLLYPVFLEVLLYLEVHLCQEVHLFQGVLQTLVALLTLVGL
jgi:hypothetical protein